MNRVSSVAVIQLSLAATGFLINFFWEMVQSPLYDDVKSKPYAEILISRMHCTVGDVVILLGAYWIVALATGDRFWVLQGRMRDVVAFTALGLGYTVVSEWVNVDLRSAWGYAATMPRAPWIGTGLAPFMQWVLLPPVIVVVSRRLVGHERAIRAGGVVVAVAILSGLFVAQANAHDVSKPPTSAATRANPLARSEAVIAEGQNVYQTLCVSCHGPSGSGDTPTASAFSHRPSDFTKGFKGQTDGELFWKITKGGGPMPGYETTLTEEQRWQVIYYLRVLEKPTKGQQP